MKTGFTTYILIVEAMMEGKSFTTLQTMAMRCIQITMPLDHPQQPSYLIDGNDGGAATSRDMGKSSFISNLPVGQFSPCQHVDHANPYNVLWRACGTMGHGWVLLRF